MSSLGDYVHYDWYTYKKAGTYRIDSGQSNFNQGIFAMHSQLLYKQVYALKIPNLAQIEQKYNNLNEQQYEELKNLKDSNPQRFKEIMTLFISNLGKKYKALAPTMINEISFSNGNVLWSGDKKEIINDMGSPPPITFGSQNQSYQNGIRYQSAPRITFCDDMIRYIKESTENASHADIKILQRWKQVLLNNRSRYIRQRKLTTQVINKQGNLVDRTVKDLPARYAARFDAFAHHLRGTYTSINEINEKIQANFAEFLGNSLYYNFLTVADVSLANALNTGRTQTSSGAGLVQITELDTNEAQIWLQKRAENFRKKIPKNKKIKIKNPYTDTFINFSNIGGATSQKADIEVDLLGEFYGISMKNTNLRATSGNEEDVFAIPHVSLQDSSLMLYLMDIQKNNENLGTHYLNILADKSHTKTDSVYFQMRQQANKALTLHILLAALTGSGQLREGGHANLFAVYDKTSAKLKSGEYRVKFFDMASIISNYFYNVNGFAEPGSIYTQISNIELNNTWNINNEQSRITRLILEAKDQSIAARLTTEYLRNIYKGVQ